MGSSHGGGDLVVAVLEVVGILLKFGIVGAGFQQQHGAAGVLGKTRGQDAAGGARSYNNHVVFHLNLPGAGTPSTAVIWLAGRGWPGEGRGDYPAWLVAIMS